MTYAEFEQQKKKEEHAYRKSEQRKANIAYNKGLWGAVKYNPFKWWAYQAYSRPTEK